jgi:hypothetical protein
MKRIHLSPSLIVLAVIAVMLWHAVSLVNDERHREAMWELTTVAALIGGLAAVWVRSLAHAATAAAQGMTIRAVYLWPLRLSLRPLKLVAANDWAFYSETPAYPSDASRARRQLLIKQVAPVLIGLAFAGFAWTQEHRLMPGGASWQRFLPGGPPILDQSLAVGWNMSAIVSALLALWSVFPMRDVGDIWGGLILWTMILPGPRRDGLCAIETINGFDARGVRPRDWPTESIIAPSEPDSLFGIVLTLNRYWNHLDRGEFFEAYEAAHVPKLDKHVGSTSIPALLLDERRFIRYWLGLDGADPSLGAEMHGGSKDYRVRYRSHCAELLREGKSTEAVRLLTYVQTYLAIDATGRGKLEQDLNKELIDRAATMIANAARPADEASRAAESDPGPSATA